MPTTESSMLDTLVLKLLHLPWLWEFLISLFSLQLHSRIPKCCVAFLETLQISFLLCFLGFLFLFPTQTQLTYTFHWRDTYVFSPWIATFVYQRLTSVTSTLYFFLQQPGLVETLSIFPNCPTSSFNSSGQCKSIWVLRTNCVEIPCNRDG